MAETEVKTTYEDGKLYKVSLDAIHKDPNQSRKYFNPEALEELVTSIRKHGIIQPVLFRQDDKGNLVLVAGERRFRAAGKAGLEQIPAIFTAKEGDELNLVENLFRENLTAVEEAEALARYMQKKKCKQEELAEMIGKKRSTVTEILSLMRLPEDVRKELRTNVSCSRRVLVEIAKEKTEAKMRATYKAFIKRGLTSDEVRKITRPRSEKAEMLRSSIEGLSKKIDAVKIDDKWTKEDKDKIQRVLEKLEYKINELREKLGGE